MAENKADMPNKKEKNPNPYKDEKRSKSHTPQSKPGKYLYGVSKELGKVTWPTRPQLIRYTGAVIVCIAFFAVLFWGIDTGTLTGLKELLN